MRKDLSPEQRKQVEMFLELYRRDYAESRNIDFPLSNPGREHANRLANEGMTKSKTIDPNKKVFVATVKERHGTKLVDVPIGYLFYWVTPGGKYKSDRIFIRDSHRGRGFAPRIAFRSLGRAYIERWENARKTLGLSELNTAEYLDAHPSQYATEKAVVKPLKELGLIKRHEIEGKNICLYLNKEELMREVQLIRSHDRWRGTPRWHIIRKPKLARTLAEQRRRNTQKWKYTPKRK